MSTRRAWEDILVDIAYLVAERSTCTRAKVGCVIVKDGRIIVTGYAGAPSGLPHCTDVGCEIGPGGGCIRTIHAEAGAISFAARKGISLMDATLYVTHAPCRECAKLIVNAGIQEVVYSEPYRDMSGCRFLQDAGVKVRRRIK